MGLQNRQLGRQIALGDTRRHRSYRIFKAERELLRFKQIFGGRLRAKWDESQEREASLACQLLNRMLDMDRPLSYPVS